MSKTLLEQAKELLKNIQNDPKALQKFEELVKAHAEKSKHVEMEMSPEEDKKKRIDELSKRIKACMEKMQKESMDKDDKPHAPNTPEDKAHDVAEEGESVKEAIHGLKDKSEDSKKELLSHLRSLKDKSQLRSPENREAGKESHEKAEKEEIKPIHQMTRGEYEAKFGKPRKNTTGTGGFHPHKSAVEIALNSGKHVSDEILKDYPELKKPTEKAELEKAKKPSRIEYYEDNQKGIHKPDMANAGLRDRIKSKQVQGKSFAGYLVREGKGEPENIHKEKLAELKAMPNPNLPKTEKSEDYYRNLVKSTLEKQLMTPPLGMSEKEEMEKAREGQPADETAARELHLFATNDSNLYHGSAKPIIENLARKHAKGVYDHEKAAKLWGYHADRAAKEYTKQFGGDQHTFNPSTRKAVAEKMRDEYLEHVEDRSKELTKPKTESSKSVHGTPGKNRPLHSRGINEPVSVSIPKHDQDAKEKSLAGLKVRRKDISGAKEAHKEILSEMKAQKKPNLPKSEMAKAGIWERTNHKDDKAIDANQKGVHRPARPSQSGEIFSAHKKGSGFSHAGLEQRKNPSFKNPEKIKEQHHKIIAEQKAMKKPNLPKSEMAKEQVEPTVQPKPKAIIPAAGGSDNGDNRKPKKPVKFIFPKKTQKTEDYYKDLVKAVIRGPWGGGPEKPGTVLYDEKSVVKPKEEKPSTVLHDENVPPKETRSPDYQTRSDAWVYYTEGYDEDRPDLKPIKLTPEQKEIREGQYRDYLKELQSIIRHKEHPQKNETMKMMADGSADEKEILANHLYNILPEYHKVLALDEHDTLLPHILSDNWSELDHNAKHAYINNPNFESSTESYIAPKIKDQLPDIQNALLNHRNPRIRAAAQKHMDKSTQTNKSETYYRNLVKSTLEKGDVHDIKTGKKIASSPTEKTPKEAQPIVRDGKKGITTRKELKQKFSPDIMPEEKDVPGGTETKKSN